MQLFTKQQGPNDLIKRTFEVINII